MLVGTWEAAVMAQVPGFLLPTCEAWIELPVPGFGLTQACCRPSGIEPANKSSVSLFYVS